MEGLNDKLDRVSGDVNQLVELYEFAEKLYPYENIREPTKLNENDQRRNVAAVASYGNGLGYLHGTAFWGFLTVVLMNRAAAGTFFDSTPLTKNPARTLLWFLTGASFAAIANVTRFRETGYDRKTYQLHQRVAQNEHTHAVLKNMKFHLQTRKMSVWDASPQ